MRGPVAALLLLLVACSPPEEQRIIADRTFADVEVVSAFLAHVDDQTGKVTRVCGPALAGEVALAPNAVELVVNLLALTVAPGPCTDKKFGRAWDYDRSIMDGDRIELITLTAQGPAPTIVPQQVRLDLDCLGPHKPGKGVCQPASQCSDCKL